MSIFGEFNQKNQNQEPASNPRELTLSSEQREWLVSRESSGWLNDGINISVWEKNGLRRLYIGIGKDRVWFNLNDASDLSAIFNSPATVAKIQAYIAENMVAEAEAASEVEIEAIEENEQAIETPVFHGFLRTGSYMDAERNTKFFSDDEIYASYSAPLRNQPVSTEQAEALRSGTPYKLSDADIERLYAPIGFDGAENDPLIIKGLARDFVMENPKWRAEQDAMQARIAELKAQYGDGDYTIGVGSNYYRWILTAAGRQWANENL